MRGMTKPESRRIKSIYRSADSAEVQAEYSEQRQATDTANTQNNAAGTGDGQPSSLRLFFTPQSKRNLSLRRRSRSK